MDNDAENQDTNASHHKTDEPDEDISDETLVTMHDRALQEERKKFASYLKYPYSSRSRANRRIDSHASSGTNTPINPTSPGVPTPNEPEVGWNN